MEPKRLAVLVPNGLIRGGIEALMRRTAYAVVPFEDLDAVVQAAETIDILLLDTSGWEVAEIEAALERLAGCCGLRVIVISDRLKAQHIKHVMQMGAKGFLFRDDLSEALVDNINLVARDVVTMSPSALELVTTTETFYHINDLKPQDMQVLRLTADGLTVKAIAAKLAISTRSVYRSRDKLREVLGTTNTVALVEAAREQGLLDA